LNEKQGHGGRRKNFHEDNNRHEEQFVIAMERSNCRIRIKLKLKTEAKPPTLKEMEELRSKIIFIWPAEAFRVRKEQS